MAKEKESKEIAEVKPAGLPTEIFSGMEADATNASGFEGMSADDCAVPFLMLLQATSKKINGPAPLVGAKAGDLFNTVSNEIFQPPFRVIPCAFKKSWVEWRPRELGGGFVKEHATDELVMAMEKLLAGGRYISATLAEHMAHSLVDDAPQHAHAQLGRQEYRVMLQLAAGKRVTDIAEAMHLSPKTVSTYRSRIFEKLGVTSNVELARYCQMHQITGDSA